MATQYIALYENYGTSHSQNPSRVYNFHNRKPYSIPVLGYDKCLGSIATPINNAILHYAWMLMFSASSEAAVSSSYPQSEVKG